MTQHEAQRANFGPSWPEVVGFGAAGPNKQFLSFPARENLKNVQVSRHLPCLPFSGKRKALKGRIKNALEKHDQVVYNNTKSQKRGWFSPAHLILYNQ